MDNNQLCRDIALKSESLNERAKHPNDFYTALEDDRTAITRTEEFKNIISTDRSIAENTSNGQMQRASNPFPLAIQKIAPYLSRNKLGLDLRKSFRASIKPQNATQIKSETGAGCNRITPGLHNNAPNLYRNHPRRARQRHGIHSHSCAIAVRRLQAACTQAELSQLADPAFNDLVRHLWSMQQRLCNALFRRTKKAISTTERPRRAEEHKFFSMAY